MADADDDLIMYKLEGNIFFSKLFIVKFLTHFPARKINIQRKLSSLIRILYRKKKVVNI